MFHALLSWAKPKMLFVISTLTFFTKRLVYGISDRVIALFHAVAFNKYFNKAIDYYQFNADVDGLQNLEQEKAVTLAEGILPISLIEQYKVGAAPVFLLKGGFGEVTELLANKGYFVELVNPANSHVPGGAVRRHVGTLDEHLSRISLLQDKIRFSLYKKVNKIDDQEQKIALLKVLDKFYGLTDRFAKLASHNQLKNLSWFQRAKMIYSVVLAERQIIHSEIAKIDSGEYERMNNVLMWTRSDESKEKWSPRVVDFSQVVAPDLRWLAGVPYIYKPFPFLNKTTNAKYAEEIKLSIRTVLERAKADRALVFPALGCGAFLGEPDQFAQLLYEVLQEPANQEIIKQKNLTICLALVGGAFHKISQAFDQHPDISSLSKKVERNDFPIANRVFEPDMKSPQAVLFKYQENKKKSRQDIQQRSPEFILKHRKPWAFMPQI